MPDPSPVEIDDVLASVRRLVAQDLGKATGLDPHAPPAAAPQAEPASSLLLTPALRVVHVKAGASSAPAPTTPEETAAPQAAAGTTEPLQVLILQDRIDLDAPQDPTAQTAPAAADDWADLAEAEVLRELAGEGLVPVAPAVDPAVPPALSEQALRDMVRQMVREELQGAFGDAVANNLRRLIRAEVARSLALRDFEQQSLP